MESTVINILAILAAVLVYLTFLILVYLADYYGPVKIEHRKDAPTFFMHYRYKKNRDRQRQAYFIIKRLI